jgi:hypothetical protein
VTRYSYEILMTLPPGPVRGVYLNTWELGLVCSTARQSMIDPPPRHCKHQYLRVLKITQIYGFQNYWLASAPPKVGQAKSDFG